MQLGDSGDSVIVECSLVTLMTVKGMNAAW